MRLIKTFGLAAIAAVAAMAFVGASSAMATGHTALCKTHEDPCAEANLVKNIHMQAGTTILKTSLATVLCLKSSAVAHAEHGGLSLLLVIEHPSGEKLTIIDPLGFQVLTLTWENCGTNAAHNNCTVTNLKLPLIDLLKTALNLGTATVLGAEVLVNCVGILHCVYGGKEITGFNVEGALHTAGAGHGMFTANELSVPNVGGLLCPSTSKWTALYEPLEHIFGSS